MGGTVLLSQCGVAAIREMPSNQENHELVLKGRVSLLNCKCNSKENGQKSGLQSTSPQLWN